MAKSARARQPRPDDREEPAGLPARRLAWDIVDEVMRSGRALDEVFERAARAAALEARDEALARAIAVVAFRRFGTIRRALVERMAKGLPKGERVLALLATAAAQVLFLDVPDHAAVDVTVRLAQSEGPSRHLAGLANAVLRRLARERDAILADADALDGRHAGLARGALARRLWRRRAAPIAEAHRRGGAIDLTVARGPGGLGRAPRRDAAADRDAAPATSAVRDPRAAGLRRGRLVGAGRRRGAAGAPPRRAARRARRRPLRRARRQDGATRERRRHGARGRSLPASAQAPGREHGAPASRGRHQGRGRADARGRALRRRPPRRALLGDRHHPPPSGRRLDEARGGPCEARRPAGAAPRQGGGADPKPGGRLVYCTCSLEPEEGERQAESFLARHPAFAPVPVRADELPGLERRSRPRATCARFRHQGGAALRSERPRRLLHRPLLASRPLTGHDPVKAALTNDAHRNASGAASGGEGAGVKWGPDRWRLYGLALRGGRDARRSLRFAVCAAHPLPVGQARPASRRRICARAIRPSRATSMPAVSSSPAGRSRPAGARPSTCDPPSRAWAEALYGFGWLRHLRAAETALARANARALVAEFLDGRPAGRRVARSTPVLARRTVSFLAQSPLLLEGADHDFYRRFLRAIDERGARARSRHALREPAAASAHRRDRALLCRALLRGARSAAPAHDRHPGARARSARSSPTAAIAAATRRSLIELLLDLLPLRQSYAGRAASSRRRRCTGAIDRMLPLLRLFRLGDGSLARFNGMGAHRRRPARDPPHL